MGVVLHSTTSRRRFRDRFRSNLVHPHRALWKWNLDVFSVKSVLQAPTNQAGGGPLLGWLRLHGKMDSDCACPRMRNFTIDASLDRGQ